MGKKVEKKVETAVKKPVVTQAVAPKTAPAVAPTNLERVLCNGCALCHVKCDKGVYAGTCDKHGALHKLVYGGTALFLLGAKKCTDRK